MKEKLSQIISEIDLEIDEIDLYGYELLKLLFQWYINCVTIQR